jgi:hypothetical protein
MKKTPAIIILAILLTLFSVSAVFAKGRVANLKGEVTAVNDDGTITMITTKGYEVVVRVPSNYAVQVGDFVHVKGWVQVDGSVMADWVKPGEDDDDEKEDEKNGDGGKANSAFCSGRKDKPHPVAAGISQTYGMPVADVMAYFCDGHGFGQIMLALQTKAIKGTEVSETLGSRKAGIGWGQIWKGLGMIGKPGHASSPPGHLKRPPWAGPPEGKGWKK